MIWIVCRFEWDFRWLRVLWMRVAIELFFLFARNSKRWNLNEHTRTHMHARTQTCVDPIVGNNSRAKVAIVVSVLQTIMLVAATMTVEKKNQIHKSETKRNETQYHIIWLEWGQRRLALRCFLQISPN